VIKNYRPYKASFRKLINKSNIVEKKKILIQKGGFLNILIWNNLSFNDSEADNTIIIKWLIASRFLEQGFSHAINDAKLSIVTNKRVKRAYYYYS
jgi:hypothetical protein